MWSAYLIHVSIRRLIASFDTIAKKRRVYKVETVGDCYIGKKVGHNWNSARRCPDHLDCSDCNFRCKRFEFAL